MSYRRFLAPILAALALTVSAAAFFSGVFTSQAVQNPSVSFDMVTAGNGYDETTNSMTVGVIQDCLATAPPGNAAQHTHTVHLVIQNVEDLVGWQARMNYTGDQFRPNTWGPAPFTDNNTGQTVSFLNLPIDQASFVHRDQVSATDIPPSAPGPQTALVGAVYQGTQDFAISPDTPAKAVPDDSSYSTSGGGVLASMNLQVVGNQQGQSSLFINLDDASSNGPGTDLQVFTSSGLMTISPPVSQLGDAFHSEGSFSPPPGCAGAATPTPTPSPTPCPACTATPTPTPVTPTATPFPQPTNGAGCPTPAPGGPTPTPCPTPTRTATPTATTGIFIPDLVVDSISDAQDPFDCSSPVGVNVVVRNLGNAGAGPSTTRVSAANSGDSELVATPALAAGQAVTLYAAVAGLPIGDTYTAVADFLGSVQEANETNNSRSASFSQRSLPTCTPTPSATPCAPEGCPTATPTPTPPPVAGHDARLTRIGGVPKNVRLSPGEVINDNASIVVANESNHTETIGVYVDVQAPSGCIPSGRVLQNTVTLASGDKTTILVTDSYSCSDVSAANGQSYTWTAVADHGADDLSSCGPGTLQSLGCFNALADDDEDAADNRRSRTGPKVIAQ